MREVSPKVFLIAGPQIYVNSTSKWLSHAGVNGPEYVEEMKGTDAECLVMLGGKRCYMSFAVGLNKNITRVREDMADFIGNILKVGHGSVIAHAHFTFAIEGISRVGTAELNRHMIGAHRLEEMPDMPDISEGSQRFIRFDDIPFVMPMCLKVSPDDTPAIMHKKQYTQDLFRRAFKYDEEIYSALEEIWKDELAPESKFHNKKAITSMMRRVVGSGVASGGIWTYSLRALRNIFTMRCAPEAEEEILFIANQMLELMREQEPNFFKDFELVDGYYQPKYHKV